MDILRGFARSATGISKRRGGEPGGHPPQNLRLYEARGLCAPSRREGVPAFTAITTLSDSVALAVSWRLDLI